MLCRTMYFTFPYTWQDIQSALHVLCFHLHYPVLWCILFTMSYSLPSSLCLMPYPLHYVLWLTLSTMSYALPSSLCFTPYPLHYILCLTLFTISYALPFSLCLMPYPFHYVLCPPSSLCLKSYPLHYLLCPTIFNMSFVLSFTFMSYVLYCSLCPMIVLPQQDKEHRSVASRS